MYLGTFKLWWANMCNTHLPSRRICIHIKLTFILNYASFIPCRIIAITQVSDMLLSISDNYASPYPAKNYIYHDNTGRNTCSYISVVVWKLIPSKSARNLSKKKEDSPSKATITFCCHVWQYWMLIASAAINILFIYKPHFYSLKIPIKFMKLIWNDFTFYPIIKHIKKVKSIRHWNSLIMFNWGWKKERGVQSFEMKYIGD